MVVAAIKPENCICIEAALPIPYATEASLPADRRRASSVEAPLENKGKEVTWCLTSGVYTGSRRCVSHTCCVSSRFAQPVAQLHTPCHQRTEWPHLRFYRHFELNASHTELSATCSSLTCSLSPAHRAAALGIAVDSPTLLPPVS